MKTRQEKRNGFALLFVISCFVTGWFAVKLIVEAVFVFALLNVILLVFLIRENRLLFYAKLIWDNRILSVPSAIISMSLSKEKKEVEEIVVSTFGILIGNKIYKWGLNGVHGVRLKTIELNRSWIFLNFGDDDENMQVKLLHGLADIEEVEEIKEKFWNETGVKSVVMDW